MEIQAFCAMMERITPPALAMEGDRIGLLIGTDHAEIKRILVALDLTTDVADEAIRGGYDLVLTHHPIFWNPVTRMLPDRYETAAAYRLIRHGIGMYAAHTNLDAAQGGVNDALCDALGLHDRRPLPPENLGRIGMLASPMRFSDFTALCEQQLDTRARIVGDPNRTVQSVAVIGGSGGGDVEAVHAAGCDAFVTGEMKHSQALEAAYLGLCCCVLGHHETEILVLKPLISRLQREENDVQYDLTRSGKAPLPCPEGGRTHE